MRVGLIASSGGHLDQLYALHEAWSGADRFWVTFPTSDAEERLAGERWYPARHPTTQHVPNLVRNLALARRVLDAERPDVLVSSGAAVAVPFFLLGKRRGIRLIFVEVIDRIDTPSRTGRVLAPLCDAVVLQWEAQRAHYPRGVVLGTVW